MLSIVEGSQISPRFSVPDGKQPPVRHLPRGMSALEKRVWEWKNPPDDEHELLAFLLERWKLDPIMMAVEAFRTVLMPYQVQLALDLDDAPAELYEFYGMDPNFPKRKVLAPSGHGLGKTRFMAFAMWRHLLTRQFSKVLVTAPSSDQLTGQLWGELRQLKRRLAYCSLFPGMAEEWEILGSQVVHKNPDYGDWTILARTARPEKPEALQGAHALDADDEFGDLAQLFGEKFDKTPSGGILICAEEASGIDDSIREVLDGALSEPGARFLAPGNPTRPDGWFARDMDKTDQYAVHPLDCRVSDRRQIYTMKYRDFSGNIHYPRIRGFVDPLYVKTILDECDGDEDADRFRVRVRGIKPRSALESCLKANWIDAAMARAPCMEDAYCTAIVGLDFGLVNDKHGIAVRKGFTCLLCEEWLPPEHPNLVLMEATRRAIDAVEIFGARLIIGDSNGVGAGPMSYLSEYYNAIERKNLGVRVIHFNAGAGALDDRRYYRRRDEMWHKKGRAWLSDPRCSLPPDAALKSQLLAPGYSEDATKRIAVESKKDIKKRIKEKSGNKADALLQTLLWEADNIKTISESTPVHPAIFQKHFDRCAQRHLRSRFIQ